MSDPDPFDRCACGHSRRAHLQSYDGGLGLGGCAGWRPEVSEARREFRSPIREGDDPVEVVVVARRAGPCPCERFEARA